MIDVRQIRITYSARTDISDIKKWYKKQSPQALENFINELFAGIDVLQKGVIEHKPVYGNYKRCLLKKFPYTIYYQLKEEENMVEIKAVLHNKRDSGFVSGKL